MATPTRIYAVKSQTGLSLVRAVSKHQAISHLAKATFTADVADPELLVKLVSGGAKVEDARADHDTQELFPAESV
jgi:hypothetical protein